MTNFKGGIFDRIRRGHMYNTVSLVNKITRIKALSIIGLSHSLENYGQIKVMFASCHGQIGLLPQPHAFAV